LPAPLNGLQNGVHPCGHRSRGAAYYCEQCVA
jgi:hypothetical protein